MNFVNAFGYLKEGKWLKSTTIFGTDTYYLRLEDGKIYLSSESSANKYGIPMMDSIDLKDIKECDLGWLSILLGDNMDFSIYEPKKIVLAIPQDYYRELEKHEQNCFIDSLNIEIQGLGYDIAYYDYQKNDSIDELINQINLMKQCSAVYFPKSWNRSTNTVLLNLIAENYGIERIFEE